MRAFYLALLTSLIWGCVPLLEKAGLAKTNPLTGLFIRSAGVLIGAAIFFAIFRPFQEISQINAKTFLLFLTAGFLASFVGQITLYHALKIGNASQVVPLAATYPLVTFILSIIFLGEAITLPKIAGVLLVISGIFFLRG